MPLTLVPFEPRLLDPAAELLADRHRRDRAREPRLPATYEDAGASRQALAHSLERPGARGVVALRDGRPLRVGDLLTDAQREQVRQGFAQITGSWGEDTATSLS